MEEELFRRSKYSDSLRLTAADLENQQDYDSKKRRLLNSALFGQGIVYGMTVKNEPLLHGVSVGAGLAFDALGRELFMPKERFFPTAQLFPEPPAQPDGWCLCIRYREWECGEGHVLEPDGTHRVAANRIAEEVQVLVLQNPDKSELCIARLLLGTEPVWQVEVLAVGRPVELAAPRGQGRVASGTIRFSGGEQGQVLYSEETPHGLGPGNVLVSLAAEATDDGRRCIISGETGLFGPQMQLSVKLFPDSGTFVAAVCPRKDFDGKVTLRWYAQRAGGTAGSPRAQPTARTTDATLRLEPYVALLNPGEAMRFTVCGADNLPCGMPLRFRAEAGGGTVDDNGCYTAPQTVGTYQITAVFAEKPEQPLYALVLVHERVRL